MGGRAHTAPARTVPRGHAASSGAQTGRPSVTIVVFPSPHTLTSALTTDDMETHAPVDASRTLPSAHARNRHPRPSYRAARPQ